MNIGNNRRERRDFLKRNPQFRKVLRNRSEKAVEEFEQMMKKQWEKNNQGEYK